MAKLVAPLVGNSQRITTLPAPGAASDAVRRDYVESRGTHLLTNGSGLMGSNYNFTQFTFDPVETHGGGGSFLKNVSQAAFTSDELTPVDVERFYRLVGWGKSGDAGGANYNAANRQYLGVALYDIDGNLITPPQAGKVPGSTDTTLAVALNVNDTTITLTDATGWYASTDALQRRMAWWPYTNAKGYSYPDYTYTRNLSGTGAWNQSAIAGNVITLATPWAGPALPVGTKVRNAASGGTYKYITAANVIVPNVWTRYEGYIGGSDPTSALSGTTFFNGTAFAKVLFLVNYHAAADNNIRWSDLALTDLSVRNLENPTIFPGGATIPGALLLPNALSAATGLVLGGDAVLYRAAADLLATDDLFGVQYSQTDPTKRVGLRVGHTGSWSLYAQSAIDNNGDAWIGHNAYTIYNDAPLARWNASHASFGSRAIRFSFATGIRFFADVAAATADATFTPTERLRIANDGKVDIYAANSLATALTLAGDARLYRSAANTLRTDGLLVVAPATYNPQSTALIAAINQGNDIEFGHSNTAGYRSTIGAETGSGRPFLAFHAEAGSTVNQYRTRGIQGSVIQSDLAGGFIFGRVPLVSADSQTLATLMTLSAAGVLTLGGDANLYRSAADVLATDDSLYVAKVLGIGIAPNPDWLIGAVGNTGNSLSSGYGLYTDLTTQPTTALANTYIGASGIARIDAAAATGALTGWSIGMRGLAAYNGGGTARNLTNLIGIRAELSSLNAAGSVSNATAVYAQGGTLQMPTTNYYGVRVNAPVLAGGGSLVTAYGLYIPSYAGVVASGAVHAIYVAGGTSRLDGALGLGVAPGATGRLQIVAGTDPTDGIVFGTDTNLYRSAADRLKTDDALIVGKDITSLDGEIAATRSTTGLRGHSIYVSGDTFPRFSATTHAKGVIMDFGPGNAPPDVNLYRDAADVLRTDDSFAIGGTLILPTGAGAGRVLTSDASGNSSWATASGGGTSFKAPVFAACDVWINTTAPGTVFDGQTIPGVGSRLLLLNQEAGAGALSRPELNGIWVYNGSAVPLTRPTDFQSAADAYGAFVFVMEGATYHDTAWVQTFDQPLVFGTDPITFVQFAKSDVFVGPGTPPAPLGAATNPPLWIDSDDTGLVVGGAPPLVTSLPLAPYDGQEVYYNADPTGGVVWHLRYRTASASAYKWEFMGGAPLRSNVDTDQTFTAAATYVDAATVGPQITLPLAGDYTYHFNLNLYVSGQTAAGNGAAGLSLAGAQPAIPDLGQVYLSSGIGGVPARNGALLSQPSARVVKVVQSIAVALGGTPHTRMRELQITPVRVA